MSISTVDPEQSRSLVDGLSEIIDFKKDLPAYVFVGGRFRFWLFERPLFDFLELFSTLIENNFSNFDSNVAIKCSGSNLIDSTFLSLDNKNVETDVLTIHKDFQDFFGGKPGYPIVIFNEKFDWVAFESAYEEFGVLGVREGACKSGFLKFLDANLIPIKNTIDTTNLQGSELITVEALRKAYMDASF
jgi:hypothetical protein